MTELEIYLHATTQTIKDALMSKGLSTDIEFFIAALCDTSHREFLKKVGEEIKNREVPAPTGPGGLHHS